MKLYDFGFLIVVGAVALGVLLISGALDAEADDSYIGPEWPHVAQSAEDDGNGVNWEMIPPPKYDRDDWKHWTDEDGDGLNTRHEVLMEESIRPTPTSDGKVLSGEWLCPYTGITFVDPKNLDVDHRVPLGYAHDNGGATWSAEKKEAYANWMGSSEHLVATQASANRRKGKKGPSGYMPPVNKCEYAIEWIRVTREWGITMPEVDQLVLYDTLVECLFD